MRNKDVSLKKKIINFVSSLAVIYLALVAILSFYYKSLLVSPTDVWQGARTTVNAIGGSGNSLLIERDFVAESAKYIKDTQLNLSEDMLSKLEHTDELTFQIMETQAQLATFQERNAEFKESVNQLQQVNQQLGQSELILNSLNQDKTSAATYGQVQAVRRAEIQAALDEVGQAQEGEGQQDIPTFDSLASSQEKPDQYAQKIPQEVLNNVERTSGITADEINKLFDLR